MITIGRKAAELERTKLQSEIQRQQSELRQKHLENRLKMAKKGQGKQGEFEMPKHTKTEADEEEIEDLEELLEEPVRAKKHKMMSLYTALGKDEFVMGSKDWKSRPDARQKRIAVAEKDKDDNDEEETEEQRLKRETVELQSELQKTERAAAAAQDKRERDRAKRYSQRITGGGFLKQPKAVTLVAATKKKKKSMKMGDIASAEEEDEPDTIPEGFHLQEESPHCVNMERSEDFQAYLRQVVAEFERLLKSGAKNIEEAYRQVVESFYWACRANKNTIIKDADWDEILSAIKDPTCRAWKMKLLGRKMLDPTSIIQEEANWSTDSIGNHINEPGGDVSNA